MASALLSSLGTRSALLGQQRTRSVASRSMQVVRAIDTPGTDTLKASGETKRQFVKNMAGVSQPFPEVFDPLNLEDQSATVQDVRRWRESEITHGRVAMLAVLGFLAQEYVEDTGFGPFPHVVGPAIGHFQQVEAKGGIFWEPLVLAIGLAETYRAQVGWAFPVGSGFNQLRDDHEPGNIGFDPLGLLPEDPAARKDIQTKELNNGRLAMIAIAGFVAQEFVDGQEIVEHLTGGRGGPGVPGSTYTELLDKVPKNS